MPRQIDYIRGFIGIQDLDFILFDALGGIGKMWKLFGNETTLLIKELNEELIA